MTSITAGLRRAISRVASHARESSSMLPLVAGQPTHDTHPELLEEGELAPGLPASEFALRRQRLAAAMIPGSIALVPATAVAYMTGVIPFPYRPDADFLHLTGLAQPGAVAVVEAETGDLTLFYTDPDVHRERWDGARMSATAATDVFGAAAAFPMSELSRRLPGLTAAASAVYYDPGRHATSELSRLPLERLGGGPAGDRFRGLRALMHRLRWRKSPGELALMRRASALAEQGLLRCMRDAPKGLPTERHMAAEFEAHCRMGGAARMAYPPVVASGVDACTIHYSRNDKTLREGDLVLFDGGCEYQGYCSDVTRTWPLNGKFSPAQRDVYQIVHSVQQEILAWCRPGATLREMHERSVRLLAEGVADLGIVPGRSAGAIAAGPIRAFYPHSVGHWLGMDTHDTATMPHDTPLQPGVNLTVEPGLYIPDDARFGALAGIGVRIEDVVEITVGTYTINPRPELAAEGPQCNVISRTVPTDADSIEAFLAAGQD